MYDLILCAPSFCQLKLADEATAVDVTEPTIVEGDDDYLSDTETTPSPEREYRFVEVHGSNAAEGKTAVVKAPQRAVEKLQPLPIVITGLDPAESIVQQIFQNSV